MILNYHLKVSAAVRPGVAAALELIFDGLGAAGREVSAAEDAHVLYSPSPPPETGKSALWISSCDPSAWTTPADWRLATACYRALASAHGRTVMIPADLLRLVYSVASGQVERTLPKNTFGVPLLAAEGTVSLLSRPVVSEVVEGLAELLRDRLPSFVACLPRWPNGHSAAILLTHDVDRPYSRPRAQYFRDRLVRRVADGQFLRATRSGAGWLRARAAFGAQIPTAIDPNFGFQFWRDTEEGLGARGCFYVAVRSSAERGAHPADVAYDAADPEIVQAMRVAVEAGWEVGLHASIECANDPARFAEEKAILERLLGQQVRGVRHHYWNLGEKASATWRAQAAVGFDYDSSLGTNDGPGFRRGLAWPFRPDAIDGMDTGLLQIPPTLMDGGVFYQESDAGAGRTAILEHFEQVLATGGAAVLDWHLEQSNPNRLNQAGPALIKALEAVSNRSDIWWPTPVAMAAWWREREERRLALLKTRDRISIRGTAKSRRHRPAARLQEGA